MNTITLYFLGRHRCVSFSGPDFEDVRQQVEVAIASTDSLYKAYMLINLNLFARQNLLNLHKVSSEFGCWCISWQTKPLDEFAAAVIARTSDMPEYPGLLYPETEAVNQSSQITERSVQ